MNNILPDDTQKLWIQFLKLVIKTWNNAQPCEVKATLSPRNLNFKMIYDNTRWSWTDLQLFFRTVFFRLVRKIVRSYCHIHVCLSVWRVSAPTGRIFMKMIYVDFSKICRENLSFIKISQENGNFTWKHLYICVNISLNSSWQDKCFKVVEKIKTHGLCSVSFISRQSCHLWDNMLKYNTARQATDEIYCSTENAFCVHDN